MARKWWRRGELNPFGVLIHRNLFILRFNQICPNVKKSQKSSSPLYSGYTDQCRLIVLNGRGLAGAPEVTELVNITVR